MSTRLFNRKLRKLTQLGKLASSKRAILCKSLSLFLPVPELWLVHLEFDVSNFYSAVDKLCNLCMLINSINSIYLVVYLSKSFLQISIFEEINVETSCSQQSFYCSNYRFRKQITNWFMHNNFTDAREIKRVSILFSPFALHFLLLRNSSATIIKTASLPYLLI